MNRSKYIETSSIKQFTIAHLLKFGETLAITASKHLGVYLNEYEDMSGGMNIELDYGLSETHTSKKVVLNTKSTVELKNIKKLNFTLPRSVSLVVNEFKATLRHDNFR